MKVLIIIIAIFLTGCYPDKKCVNGELYYNVHPFAGDNIYAKLNTDCEVIE
jgi:hypothetical protein